MPSVPRLPVVLRPCLLVSICTALQAAALRSSTSVEHFALIRIEGTTELVGDLVLTFEGGTPTAAGQPIPTVDLEVAVNTTVTSRALDGARTEALLLVDDPAPAAQVVGKNVFQGERSRDGLRWVGVLFDPPGETAKRKLRFKNIRVDASSFDSEPGGIADITLTVSATAVLAGVVDSAPVKVATTQPGLEFDVGDAAGGVAGGPVKLLRSHDNNAALLGDPTADFSSPGGRSFTLRFEEKFNGSFRPRVVTNSLGEVQGQADPSSPSFTETGFFNPGLPAAHGINRAGLADSGTRLLATFSNVPAGVAVFVTVAPVRPSSSRFVDAMLVGADANGATKGETRAVIPTSPADEGIAPVAITNGTGQAVWEITRADFDALDAVVFGITVAYLRDVPELATASVDGRFAPHAAAESQGKFIPLFAGEAARERAFEISIGDACRLAARDIVLGNLTDPLKDDVFAFDALTGTLLDLDVRAKGGTTPVELRLFDPSLESIDIGPFLKARGRSTRLKRFPLLATGQYEVVLRSTDGAPTGYRLQVLGKLPKEKLNLKAVSELRTPEEKLVNSFEAVGGSILNVILKGKGTDPEILELVGPSGSPAESGEVVLALGSSFVPGLKTERVKNFLLPLTGVYRLAFTGKGAAGILNLSIRVKGPNRRVLAECAE